VEFRARGAAARQLGADPHGESNGAACVGLFRLKCVEILLPM
jgi:hypothetical protein